MEALEITDYRVNGVRRLKGFSQTLPLILFMLKLLLPYTTLSSSGEEEIMDILNAFDVRLIPWVFVLNIIGYWMKKMKTPKWLPPIPVVLMLFSFLICSAFGWAYTDATGAKAMFIALVEYGLGNGVIVALLSTYGYDTVHAITKRVGGKSKKESNNLALVEGGKTNG